MVGRKCQSGIQCQTPQATLGSMRRNRLCCAGKEKETELEQSEQRQSRQKSHNICDSRTHSRDF